METPTLIQIDLIQPNPYQPRQMEDPAVVAELADSIVRNGLMQVPTARQVNGHYQLAFGHTRLAAFKMLQEPTMPLIIRELDDLQMFELGVAENIKRRDLNPVEQAEAMRRYMDEFHKTSVEAGEFFNVSEEQVRGTVRLINLVPEAQESLAAGRINITAARSLLSMQKIAPEKAVLEAVKKMEKGRDEYGQVVPAESIIERAVRKLDETVDMWNDNRDGKPRSHSGYRESGWLLSMKNYPNKLLPQLTPVDAAIALAIQDDEQTMEIVEKYLDAVNNAEDYGDQETANEAKQMRQEQLVAVNPALWDKLQLLLNPPACSACPFYTKINGSHFCGIKTCHTRKTEAWRIQQIQSASRDLKIELYTDTDGKYKLLDSYDQGDAALFKRRHKDLRLIEREKIRGYHYQHFVGLNDNVCFVVVVGKTRENMDTARKEARAEVKQKASVAERREELVLESRKHLEWEATLSIKTLFDSFNMIALKALEEAGFDWSADGDDVPEDDWVLEDAPEEAQAEFQRRIFALSMIHEAPGRIDARATTSEGYATWLVETAKGWGVKMHRSLLGIAKRLDEEIRAVTTETAEV